MIFSTEAQDRLAKVRKHIEETNAAFLAAPREERRIMVAKDILFQLEIGRLIPKSVYVGPDDFYQPAANVPEQIQDFMKSIPACDVCGIGALFVTTVERLDDLTLSAFRDVKDPQAAIHQYLSLKEMFTTTELRWVEEFFELHLTSFDCYLWRYTTKEVRMKHLAQLLIDTKGAEITKETFRKPPTEAQLGESLPEIHWRHAFEHYHREMRTPGYAD